MVRFAGNVAGDAIDAVEVSLSASVQQIGCGVLAWQQTGQPGRELSRRFCRQDELVDGCHWFEPLSE